MTNFFFFMVKLQHADLADFKLTRTYTKPTNFHTLTKSFVNQVKTMGLNNQQGWKLNTGITIKKNNPNLFLALVNLKTNAPNEFYIYKYDDFVDRVNITYLNYIDKPHSRTGKAKKDVKFRWFNFSDFNNEDKSRKNDWSLILKELN